MHNKIDKYDIKLVTITGGGGGGGERGDGWTYCYSTQHVCSSLFLLPAPSLVEGSSSSHNHITEYPIKTQWSLFFPQSISSDVNWDANFYESPGFALIMEAMFLVQITKGHSSSYLHLFLAQTSQLLPSYMPTDYHHQ